MEKIMDRDIPETLDEAVNEVLKMLKSYDDIVQKYETEQSFLGHTHHFFGMNLRNNWMLWWYPTHLSKEWPAVKPRLVQWFNDVGINHADDMSTMILRTAYRRFKGQPEDIMGQVTDVKRWWAGKQDDENGE